jgi:hypothetical protein
MKKWFKEHEEFAVKMILVSIMIMMVAVMINCFDSTEFIIDAESIIPSANVENQEYCTQMVELMLELNEELS